MATRRKRNIIVIITSLLLLAIAAGTIAYIDHWVTSTTKDRTYADVALIPGNRTGLLLGTSKYINIKRHLINPYYKHRIDAAVALYRAGKVQYIIVSGDNSSTHYNEPEVMKRDLIARGIPATRIFLDYAGLHTLDSILRCRDIFGQDSITVISQSFQNERAIFIADHKGIMAIGCNAQDVTGPDGSKVLFREKFSRIKMMLELLLNTQPKYYWGNKVEVK